jgi:hypothetical protein
MTDLDHWLGKCAASIEPPLKRRKMRKRHGDVTISVEIYRTRHAEIFYIEFAIYSDDLPRPGPDESKTVPIYDWRLTNPLLRRPDGYCPDLPLNNDNLASLALAREQIVVQGKKIFEAAHSLQSLMNTLREQGSPTEAYIADRIEAFLEQRTQSK